MANFSSFGRLDWSGPWGWGGGDNWRQSVHIYTHLFPLLPRAFELFVYIFSRRELVIFRENLLIKMCRNSIHLPDTSASSAAPFTSHFAKTLLGQAHLSPLPVHLSPVYWTYDHALSLYPNPDLVVVAGRHGGTKRVNVSSRFACLLI